MLSPLKRIRLEQEYPQWKLAARTGIRAPRISVIECSRVRPRLSELRRIATILRVPVEALIDDEVGVEEE